MATHEISVPAREARLADVPKGAVVEIVDVEGQQVGDLAVWLRERPDEYMSPGHTVSCLGKLVPEVGEEIFSNHRRPLLRVTRDDVRTHDLVVPCCDPERYGRDFGLTEHPSCLTSLQAAIASEQRDLSLAGEQCWNVFMNNRIEEGRIVTYEPRQGPGAKIALLALEDLIVALSACPQDLTPCNAYNPTQMALRVLTSG